MSITKILRNVSGATRNVLNRQLANEESYTIPFSQWTKLAEHEPTLNDITAELVVVNNGTSDLSVVDAFKLISRFDVQEAAETAFDNSSNGFTSVTVQAAIEEARTSSANKARYAVSCGFDGTASTGRWLEFNSNVDSNRSGFVTARASHLREISAALNSNGTVTFQVRKKDNTVLTSISLSAERTKAIIGLDIALEADLELMLYTSAGSGVRPIVWLFIEPD